jgi:hypothetical protein
MKENSGRADQKEKLQKKQQHFLRRFPGIACSSLWLEVKTLEGARQSSWREKPQDPDFLINRELRKLEWNFGSLHNKGFN